MHTTERVLSIQSHVAYGYVGGKSAVFPLQCLGYDVDVVNTVNFSNHTGYGRFGGTRTSAQDLSAILSNMEANALLSQQRFLTGYIPNGEALSVVIELAKKLRARNPDLVYLLDPVLGDSGKLYVAPDVIPLYRELLPEATVITPNWFEIEILTDTKLSDIDSLRRALKILHETYGVPYVVMSSMPLHEFFTSALPTNILPADVASRSPDSLSQSHLICISSSYTPPEDRGRPHAEQPSADEVISSVHAHVLPCVPGYYSGVGDLFSALVLAHLDGPRVKGDEYVQSPGSQPTVLSVAATFALSKTVGILRLTHAHVSALPADASIRSDGTDEERDGLEPERRVRRQRARELRLIQGQDILRNVPGASSADPTKVAELLEMRPWIKFWTSS